MVLVLAATAVLVAGPAAAPGWAAPSAESVINAPSAILVDGDSGQVLWSNNANQRRAPASTTKIMTALIVLERGNLNDSVKISAGAAAAGGSEMDLKPGARVSVRDLLYGLLLPSGNDAATALAEYVSGRTDRFVRLMNRRARQLGLKNTRYANPHGLPAAGHYSSARDLAVIARVAMQRPMFARIVGTKLYRVPWAGHKGGRVLKNHNELLWTYGPAVGIKTGFTDSAGRCLVAAARKGHLFLISVVLGEESVEAYSSDSRQLLSYGFRTFTRCRLIVAGRSYKTLTIPELGDERLNLVAAQNLTMMVPRGERGIRRVVVNLRSVKLPIRKNRRLGSITVLSGGKRFGVVHLVAAKTVRSPDLIGRVEIYLHSLVGYVLGR